MINNWEYRLLRMDYSNLKNRASDIDFIHLERDNFLFVGEIKNAQGELKTFQRKAIEEIVDNLQTGGAGLYITHNKFAQYGDTVVDLSSDCMVSEVYYKGQWFVPERAFTVDGIIDYINERRGYGYQKNSRYGLLGRR